MMLNNLKKIKKTKKAKKVGRGYGSARGGHTSGRGMKGQKSRAGYKPPRKGFEGGQMPLSRRLPKLKGFSRGFYNHKNKSIVLNIADLNQFDSGTVVDEELLINEGFIPKSKRTSIKILGEGELEKKISVSGIDLSETAKEKIKAKGGSIK